MLSKSHSSLLLGTACAVLLFPISAAAQIAPPEFKVLNGKHVNLLTDNDPNLYAPTIDITEDVLSMDGSEGPIKYTRYLTKAGLWRHNYLDVVDASDPANIWVILDNEIHIFSGSYNYDTINGVNYDGDGRGNGLTASVVNGVAAWQYVSKYGEVVTFPANTGTSEDYPTTVQSPSGLIRTYYYKTLTFSGASEPSIRLQSVVESDGTMIKFTYDVDDTSAGQAAWQHVASVALINQAYAYCDPTADHCSFTLSGWPMATFAGPASGQAPSGQTAIETSTTNTGYTRSYKKDSSGRVVGTSNVTPYQEHYTISYVGPYYKVSTINNNKGDIRTYTVNTTNLNVPVGQVASSFLGASEYYYFDNSIGNMPTKVIDFLGRTTLLSWNFPDNHLSKITYPEGNSVTYQYDTRYNIISKTSAPKPGAAGASIVETASYDTNCANINTCNKPNSYVDAKGNETDWTYTSFGMKASELSPAPVVGGARRLKLYSYTQKSAYVLNAQGVLVSTGAPIWKLTGETDCQTVAGSSALTCDANAPREDITYLYGADGTPDNLLVRGKLVSSSGTSYRTCYTYDRWRHKISETSPNAQLQVCQ